MLLRVSLIIEAVVRRVVISQVAPWWIFLVEMASGTNVLEVVCRLPDDSSSRVCQRNNGGIEKSRVHARDKSNRINNCFL